MYLESIVAELTYNKTVICPDTFRFIFPTTTAKSK